MQPVHPSLCRRVVLNPGHSSHERRMNTAGSDKTPSNILSIEPILRPLLFNFSPSASSERGDQSLRTDSTEATVTATVSEDVVSSISSVSDSSASQGTTLDGSGVEDTGVVVTGRHSSFSSTHAGGQVPLPEDDLDGAAQGPELRSFRPPPPHPHPPLSTHPSSSGPPVEAIGDLKREDIEAETSLDSPDVFDAQGVGVDGPEQSTLSPDGQEESTVEKVREMVEPDGHHVGGSCVAHDADRDEDPTACSASRTSPGDSASVEDPSSEANPTSSESAPGVEGLIASEPSAASDYENVSKSLDDAGKPIEADDLPTFSEGLTMIESDENIGKSSTDMGDRVSCEDASSFEVSNGSDGPTTLEPSTAETVRQSEGDTKASEHEPQVLVDESGASSESLTALRVPSARERTPPPASSEPHSHSQTAVDAGGSAETDGARVPHSDQPFVEAIQAQALAEVDRAHAALQATASRAAGIVGGAGGAVNAAASAAAAAAGAAAAAAAAAAGDAFLLTDRGEIMQSKQLVFIKPSPWHPVVM